MDTPTAGELHTLLGRLKPSEMRLILTCFWALDPVAFAFATAAALGPTPPPHPHPAEVTPGGCTCGAHVTADGIVHGPLRAGTDGAQ
jgi:hypothetical protein